MWQYAYKIGREIDLHLQKVKNSVGGQNWCEFMEFPAINAVVALMFGTGLFYLATIREVVWLALVLVLLCVHCLLVGKRTVFVWLSIGILLAFLKWPTENSRFSTDNEISAKVLVTDLRADNTGGYQKRYLEGKLLSVEGEECDIRVILKRGKERLQVGEVVSVKGTLFVPEPPDFDNGFNYKMYLKRRGIFYGLKICKIETRETGSFKYSFWSWVYGGRRKIANILKSGLRKYESGRNGIDGNFLCAMTLGMRNELKVSASYLFRDSGLFHLFAVSGMHVGIVGLIVLLTMRLMCLPVRVRYFILPIVVGAYVVLVGIPPSALRAWIMLTVWAVGKVVLRPTNSWNTLAVAAVIVILTDPFAPFSAGFQFSFLAVGSLVWSTQLCKKIRPVIMERFFMMADGDGVSWRGAILSFCIFWLVPSFCLFAILVPLQAFYQQKFIPLTIILCLPVAFIAALIMGLSFLKILLSMMFINFELIDGMLSVLLQLVRIVAATVTASEFTFSVLRPPIWGIALLCFLSVLIMNEIRKGRFWKVKTVAVALFVIIIIYMSGGVKIFSIDEIVLRRKSIKLAELRIGAEVQASKLCGWLRNEGVEELIVYNSVRNSGKLKWMIEKNFRVVKWIEL